MKQQKIEAFFKDPQLEYDQMTKDLKTHLPKDIVDEIIAFVNLKTDEAMNAVFKVMNDRYESVKELDESMPDKPTKEDQQKYLKKFFRLTDPGTISKDLQLALNFDNIEEDFNDFIDKMTTQEYGDIFNRYRYPSSFFNQLKQGILYHLNNLTSSLKLYAEKVGQHALVLQSVREEQKGKAIIKGGASLLGMLVGIPFAGAGVGALMGGNDQTKLHNSLNRVFEGWDRYLGDFVDYLKDLEHNYLLAMMTIYGGTFLRVHEHFKAHRLVFQELATLSGEYSLTVTPEELNETAEWMKKTTNGIHHLIQYKQYHEAIKISQNLYEIISKKPVLARTELYEGKSAIYIAHLYYYLAYQETLLEEYKNGHLDSFYKMAHKLYIELPLLVKDSDIEKDFHSSGELLLRLTKESIKRNSIEDMSSFLSYIKRTVNRIEGYNTLPGEDTPSLQRFADDYKSILVIENFLETVYGLSIDIDGEDDDDIDQEIRLKRKHYKALIQIDTNINSEDKLSAYLKKEYWKTNLLPWYKRNFNWLKKQKRRILGVILATGLLVSGYTFGDDIYEVTKEKLSAISLFNKTKETVEQPIEKPTYLTITTEYANVRSNPTLQVRL